MIPARLNITDFLSYRRQEVDFTQFEVACLTGANGQGKSSLLDAITWSLFGAARGCEGGQNQERLIRDGAERATVELAFELAGEVYRVVRSRARTGRADLQLLIRSHDGWTNLAGETLRETEARIGQLLRMDYRTFTASTFLLQGRADDFLTRMRPEDRKEVFARLLDLGSYERLEDAARLQAREADARRKTLAAQIDKLEPAVREHSDVQAEHDSALAAQAAADAAADAAVAELEALQAQLHRHHAAIEQADREETAVRELAARVDQRLLTLQRKEAELAEIDQVCLRRDEVKEALEEGEQLHRLDTELRELASRRAELETRRAEAAGRVEAETRQLEERSRGRIDQADRLEQEAASLQELQARLQEMDQLVAEAAQVEATLEDVRSQLVTLREQDAGLGAELRGVQSRIDEVAERLELLERGHSECPVCGGNLTEEHRLTVSSTLRAEHARLSGDHGAIESKRTSVRKRGRRLKEEEERLRAVSIQRDGLLREATELRTKVGRVEQLRQQAVLLRQDAEADRRMLTDGAHMKGLRETLTAVDAELKATAYDRTEHDRLRARLQELAAYRELEGRIAEAASRRPRVAGERDDLVREVESDQRDLQQRRDALATLQAAVRASQDLTRQVDEARLAATTRRDEAARAGARAATLQERLDGLRRLAEELDAARGAEREAAVDHRSYTRLTQAFGRGGIPDLIVENALPELTHEANDILGRLSDYEMSVQFAMSRETKSGKVRETFDVLVHHDGGIRDYQMFSGGEAFRIAFAIRLALSKLLVRRAGARLETLVIDEGFGTQDAEGRERIMEAINLARQEFRKVLVITHLDELKDVFDAQLSVTKTPAQGSVVHLCGT